jgi:tRNA A-37 threonylcarbamoyl transferase component Bud32
MRRDPEAPDAPDPESPPTPSASGSSVTADPLLEAAAEVWEPPASAVEALRSPSSQRATGQVLAKRYRLDERLGQGGMGEVWAATHLVTRRRIAIKFLLWSVASSPEMRHRFVREARAACAVEHPNVVQVFDVVELEDGTPVIVMELLSGETLRARLDRSVRLSLEETCSLLVPAVAAVATAHELGVVHRDLKPENIFLASEGSRGETVKVLDFGIAKVVGIEGEPAEAEPITSTGSTIGTPSYMAPEQTLGEKDVDHRADVWALGVVLYECLAGVRPLRGSTVGQVVMSLATDGVRPLAEVAPDVPEEARALIMRMLERERGARPQNLWQVHELLSGFRKGAGHSIAPAVHTKRSPRRPVPRAAWVALPVAALVIAGWASLRSSGHARGAAPEPGADRTGAASAPATAEPSPALAASVSTAAAAPPSAGEGRDVTADPHGVRVAPSPSKASTRASTAPSVHAAPSVSAPSPPQPTPSARPPRGLAETPPF